MFASGKTAAVASAANYIEEVFSTYLYTGTGSAQTITNGIDLSTKGGLVWIKGRNNSWNNILQDTNRGINSSLCTNNTDGAIDPAGVYLTSFNSNGFSIGTNGSVNFNTNTYVSWAFRKQPKFFDVVTYTGNGTNGRTVAHSLGSTPGCIIVKRTDAANGWAVYHRAMNASPQDYMMRLNATDGAFTTSPSRWNNTLPTSTEFTLSGNDEVNGSGATYVAYLFAHNAGGFGLTGTDNVISCGSFTTDGSGNATVNLGYEPQWVMIKRTDDVNNWIVLDTMRGWANEETVSSNDLRLNPNLSAAESADSLGFPTATGFQASGFGLNQTWIYIAIRRGPMKVPTSGTSVFSPVVSSVDTGTITSGFPTDMVLSLDRTSGVSGFNRMVQDRLRGSFNILDTPVTAAETNNTSTASFDSNAGIVLNGGTVYTNGFVHEQFRRAPSFFDVVCYTGTGSATTVTHNLGVAPEFMMVKERNGANSWYGYAASEGATKGRGWSSSNSFLTASSLWNDTAPTSSVFTVGTSAATNGSAKNFVAYLFATCPGVSKVGSYTGTGTTKQVDCGFTGGARFVLIKRADDVGDWYVWDTARGIVSGNDPYLLLNSTAAETTGTDYIDTYSAGFEISSTAPAAINASGGTFIFLAIA